MQRKIITSKVRDQEKLDQVFAIRRKVFVEEQECPPELEWEYEDESNHFLAVVDGLAAGACRWRKTEKGYKLERFAVLKEFRGLGVGQNMVETVLKDLPDNPGNVYLHAQLSAMGLYEKFGFIKYGEQFEEAGIQHFKMILEK